MNSNDPSRHELASVPLTPGDDDAIDYWRQLRTIWSRRWWVVSITTTAVLLVAVASMATRPAYEAVATVFLTPAAFTTSLKGKLPAGSYRQLAETGFITDKVNAELTRRAGKAVDVLAWTAEVSGSVDPKDPYASLLALTARATSPDDAKSAADVWAQVFVDEMANLSSSTKSSS